MGMGVKDFHHQSFLFFLPHAGIVLCKKFNELGRGGSIRIDYLSKSYVKCVNKVRSLVRETKELTNAEGFEENGFVCMA